MKQPQQSRSQSFLIPAVLYLMRWPDDRDNKTTMTPVHSAWCAWGSKCEHPIPFKETIGAGNLSIVAWLAAIHTR